VLAIVILIAGIANWKYYADNENTIKFGLFYSIYNSEFTSFPTLEKLFPSITEILNDYYYFRMLTIVFLSFDVFLQVFSILGSFWVQYDIERYNELS